jgi:hypothetical protein
MQSLRNFQKAISHWGIAQYGLLAAFWAILSTPLFLNGWGWFSLLSLPLFLALIVSLTFLATRFTPSAPSLSRGRTHLVKYYTSQGAVDRHGALSCIDGISRATWTVHSNGSKRTAEGSLDFDSFRKIWNDARFLRDLKVYRKTRPEDELDPSSNFIVSVMFEDGGEIVLSTYAIPHTSSSSSVKGWLYRIEASQSSAV